MAAKTSSMADKKRTNVGEYFSTLIWTLLGIFVACILISFTSQDPRWLHHLKTELLGFLGGVYVLAVLLVLSYACCCCLYKFTACVCVMAFYTLIFVVVGVFLFASAMEAR